MERIVTITRIAVSGIVLIAALYVILTQTFPEDYTKWAFGIIGVVIGYWLK